MEKSFHGTVSLGKSFPAQLEMRLEQQTVEQSSVNANQSSIRSGNNYRRQLVPRATTHLLDSLGSQFFYIPSIANITGKQIIVNEYPGCQAKSIPH